MSGLQEPWAAMSPLEEGVRSAIASIEEHQEGGMEVSCVFPEDFIGFTGHFPSRPVLPALAQIILGRIAAEALTGRSATFLGVERAKFVQQITPRQIVAARCRHGKTTGKYLVTLNTSDGVAASFTLLCAEEAPHA